MQNFSPELFFVKAGSHKVMGKSPAIASLSCVPAKNKFMPMEVLRQNKVILELGWVRSADSSWVWILNELMIELTMLYQRKVLFLAPN